MLSSPEYSPSWNDLTIVELRQALASYGIDCPSTVYKRKGQIVELCEARLSENDLLHILRQMGKAPPADPPQPAVDSQPSSKRAPTSGISAPRRSVLLAKGGGGETAGPSPPIRESTTPVRRSRTPARQTSTPSRRRGTSARRGKAGPSASATDTDTSAHAPTGDVEMRPAGVFSNRGTNLIPRDSQTSGLQSSMGSVSQAPTESLTAFDSLAASRAARALYLRERTRPSVMGSRKSTVGRPSTYLQQNLDSEGLTAGEVDPLSARYVDPQQGSSFDELLDTPTPVLKDAKTPVVRAGRFSIPSDGLVFSPARHKPEHSRSNVAQRQSYEEIQSSVVTHTEPERLQDPEFSAPSGLDAAVSAPHEQMSSPRTSFAGPDSPTGCHVPPSYWPAVDPQGNAIQWKIRDPFVFSVTPSSPRISPREPAGTTSKKSPRLETSSVNPDSQPKQKYRPTTKAHETLGLPAAGAPEAVRRTTPKPLRVGPSADRHHPIWSRLLCLLCFLSLLGILGFFLPAWPRVSWPSDRIWHPVARYSHALHQSFADWTRRLRPKPFCDGGKETGLAAAVPRTDCRPCPQQAICREGRFLYCRRPQFRQQRHRGQWICVKDATSYRRAQKALGIASELLSQLNGAAACSYRPLLGAYPVPPNISTQRLTPLWALPQRILQPLLIAALEQGSTPTLPYGPVDAPARNLTDSFETGQLHTSFPTNISITTAAAVTILFDELILMTENQQRYAIRIFHPTSLSATLQPVNYYYSLRVDKPLSCSTKEFFFAHGLALFTTLLVAFLTYRFWARRRALQLLDVALKQIISENTSIQLLGVTKGYAIGPRATDILCMLQRQGDVAATGGTKDDSPLGIATFSRRYPQYSFLVKSQRLTTEKLQALCDALVRKDSSFCRSVLCVDMVPFYYSKQMIDCQKAGGDAFFPTAASTRTDATQTNTPANHNRHGGEPEQHTEKNVDSVSRPDRFVSSGSTSRQAFPFAVQERRQTRDNEDGREPPMEPLGHTAPPLLNAHAPPRHFVTPAPTKIYI